MPGDYQLGGRDGQPEPAWPGAARIHIDHTIAFFGTRQLVWTAPFCAIGLARFAFLALSHRDDSGPTEAMLRDWPFLLDLAAWAAAVLVIIYQ